MHINNVDDRGYTGGSATPNDAHASPSIPSRLELSNYSSHDFSQAIHANESTTNRSTRSDGGFWEGLGNFLYVRTLPGFLHRLFTGGNILTGAPGGSGANDETSMPTSTEEASTEKGPYGVTSSSVIADGKRSGRIVDLSSDPVISERVDRVLNEAIRNTWRAYNIMDNPSTWTDKTTTAMKQLFGDNVTNSDVRARIKAGLANSLDGMQQMKNNKQRFFLELFAEPGEGKNVAYTVVGPAGQTGEVVLGKSYLEKNADESLMVTLAHEAIHFSDHPQDSFYVGYSDRMGFYIRNIPINTPAHRDSLKDAPENADSLAWAALLLGRNGREFQIPKEVSP